MSRINNTLALFAFFVKTALLLTAVLSVCPSHSWSTPKQFKIPQRIFHRTIERYFCFLGAKFRDPKFMDSPRTSVLNTGTPCRKRKFNQLENVSNAKALQLEAARRRAGPIPFNTSPVASLKSLSLSITVLERIYCLYVTLRCDLEL